MTNKDDGFPYADPSTPGNFAHRSAPLQFPAKKWTDDEMKALVNRFLAWPLPKSVRSDWCASQDYTNSPHQRAGANLLTADEARQMFEAILNEATP